jgi:hypothetical protein
VKPRVKNLHYNIIINESVDYENAPEITEETDEFIISMDKQKAIFEMKGHYTSVKDARKIVDDFLERWKVIIGLEHDPDDLRFNYETAEFEQIQQNGKNRIFLSAVSSGVSVSADAILHVSRSKYPSRPYRFKLSPDVITMYERFLLYRQRKEPLTSMAYMCLTVLEASARTATNYKVRNNLRGKASYQYKIDYEVLDELGRLTATKGNESEARKAPKNGVYDPLQAEERGWILRAVKILIQRAGEWAHNPNGEHGLITIQQI